MVVIPASWVIPTVRQLEQVEDVGRQQLGIVRPLGEDLVDIDLTPSI